MTTHPIFDRWLWGTLLAASFLLWLAMHCAGCGPGAGPTRTMAKIARTVVEQECSDFEPVKECLDKIDQNAAAVDELLPDGGR